VLRQLLARGPSIDKRLRGSKSRTQARRAGGIRRGARSQDRDRFGVPYLLITLMPRLHENRRLLSLACFNSKEPWALAEYFTRPEYARELYAKMHLPDGQIGGRSTSDRHLRRFLRLAVQVHPRKFRNRLRETFCGHSRVFGPYLDLMPPTAGERCTAVNQQFRPGRNATRCSLSA
jgi:hypothetical protein